MRPIELGLNLGRLKPGPRDSITDVDGVLVGHHTVLDPQRSVQTGVTIIQPSADPWLDRPVAACDVLNGHGKSLGLVQLEEMGELETPIGLTNTLAVWTVARRLAERVTSRDPKIWSVNPVVGECNDGSMNDIASFPVTDEHVDAAICDLSADVPEGNVGAGAGTRAWGYKAGIGTASRLARVQDDGYTVGALVLANTGARRNLRVDGFPVGDALVDDPPAAPPPDVGSIMMILATDAPVDSRQLGRMVRRCSLGLARVGGTATHGSGDISIGFAKRRDGRLCDRNISPLLTASVEATEAAIIHSLFASKRATDRKGETISALPAELVVRRVMAARRTLLGESE